MTSRLSQEPGMLNEAEYSMFQMKSDLPVQLILAAVQTCTMVRLDCLPDAQLDGHKKP